MVNADLRPGINRPHDFPECKACFRADDAVSNALVRVEQDTDSLVVNIACKQQDKEKLEDVHIYVDVTAHGVEGGGEEGIIPVANYVSIAPCPGREAQVSSS